MASLKEDLSDKVSEAKGMLSSLIFGKKQKKPKELVQSLQQYLQFLNQQQTLSPSLQQQAQQQAGVQGGAGAAAADGSSAAADAPAPRVSPGHGHTQSVMLSLTSPLAASAADPDAASVTADLDSIVVMLYGDTAAEATNKEPDPKLAKEVIELFYEHDLFRRLFDRLRSLEFEGRKYFTRIFEWFLSQRRDLSVAYVLRRKYILLQCIHAYGEQDVSIALSCDAILRAAIACEPVAESMLQSGGLPELQPAAVAAVAAAASASADVSDLASPSASAAAGAGASAAAAAAAASADSSSGNLVLPFFRYLDLPTFIHSHAFASFQLLLTSYPAYTALYLKNHYDVFFARYNRLLVSENYLTKVQAFTFLGLLLIERANQEIMMRYVNDSQNLKLAMMALRGPKAIQLAVFNVLKVFVPNPYKSEPILRILIANRSNFLAFLDEFEKDSEDEILCAHRAEMQQALMELPEVAPPLVKKASIGAPEEAQAAATAATAAHQQQQQQQQQQQPQQPAPTDDLP